MEYRKIISVCFLVMLANLLLASCAARPQLLPKSAVIPAGVDLSGHWQLRVEPGARDRRPDNAEQTIRIPPSNSRRTTGGRSPGGRGRPGRAAVSVFLESGESLKVTQTASGLFISFDRAVVEEYRFGENRLVSVGPIEAQRVSGWEGSRFVNETLDEAGAILVDTWELSEGGSVLVRTVSLTQGEDQIYSSEQRFDPR